MLRSIFAAVFLVTVIVASDLRLQAQCPFSPLIHTDLWICKQGDPQLKTVAKPRTLISSHDGGAASPIDKSEERLPHPWQQSEACFKDFCLFFDKESDNGIALITTLDNALTVANSPADLLSASVEQTAFYEAEVPGKGVGLIANRTIRKGEIIMQQLPALVIHPTPHMDMHPEKREDFYRSAIEQLPKKTQESFMRQMGESFYEKVVKNSFRAFVDDVAHLAVYPKVSRFNHDCRPNVHYRLSGLIHTTVAVRDIPAGTELTISYIYVRKSRAERQKELSESWNFTCTCEQCSKSAEEIAASDARMRRIKALEEDIERKVIESARKRGSEDTSGLNPDMAGELVELYLTERLDAHLGPVYVRAALLYAMFGHEEKAKEYATEAAAALEREYGPHARDIPSMRDLAERPRDHWAWGLKAVDYNTMRKNDTML